MMDLDKATLNKYLDSHPNFEQILNKIGVGIIIFIILTALKNRTVLKETFNTFKLNCQIE